VIVIVEAESRKEALDAFFKINMPVASFIEAEEVLPES